MNVIITGVSGFVGQNLVKYLSHQSYKVSTLSLRDTDWSLQQLTPANALIHLAGKAHDTSNTSDPNSYFVVNRDLTVKLFDSFLKTDIQDFYYFSSVKAVADTVVDELDEDISGAPTTPYGKSKLEAENYLLSKELPAGKRLFIIRPCMIHGPGNKGNLTLLYKVVQKGIPWPLAAFHNQRSFLGIDNLCYLMQQLIERPEIASGIYNFADDEDVSTNELVALISKSLGRQPRLWELPKNLIQIAATIGDRLRLPLNSERLKKLTESYVVSNKKIKSALHLKSLPYTVQEGLERTISSFDSK